VSSAENTEEKGDEEYTYVSALGSWYSERVDKTAYDELRDS
jgi:hypothetical protein